MNKDYPIVPKIHSKMITVQAPKCSLALRRKLSLKQAEQQDHMNVGIVEDPICSVNAQQRMLQA
jgi:hypothetical protein